jgi:hypothetical protein
MNLDIEEQKDAYSDITNNLDTDEELCAYFTGWQKAFDSLNGQD